MVFVSLFQTSHEFLWFLDPFFKNHMNSYGFWTPTIRTPWAPWGPWTQGPTLQFTYNHNHMASLFAPLSATRPGRRRAYRRALYARREGRVRGRASRAAYRRALYAGGQCAQLQVLRVGEPYTQDRLNASINTFSAFASDLRLL